MSKAVDIIVRSKNGHLFLEELLASIEHNTPPEMYRLILVDDGSDPPLQADVDVLCRQSESHGAVTATNIGLGVAFTTDAPYVLVMDNDCEVPAGDTTWLSRMIAELEQYPGTACVGATTNFANPPQNILSVPQTYTGDWEGENGGGSAENPPVRWFVSFCCLLKKEALLRCGYWDQQYNPGNYEDTDYAVQLRLAGYKVRVARSVYIHHKGHGTFGEQMARLLRENGEKFTRKWGFGRLWDLGIVDDKTVAEGLKGRAG